MKTEKLVAALRCSSSVPSAELDCRTCAFHMEETIDGKDYAGCECDRILLAAVDKIEELTDRCARYAEEIAVLQEEQKRATAADVAPVVCGRWVHHDDGVVTCSECGNAESSDSYYCRYCGAKMDGCGERDG